MDVLADDGGGTPVQDEHQGSGDEEMRSDGHHSEVRTGFSVSASQLLLTHTLQL